MRVIYWMLAMMVGLVPLNAQSGSISGSPNPCTAQPGQSFCASTITWSSSSVSQVQVWVSVSGGSEALYAATLEGTYTGLVTWIQAFYSYSFRLYDYSSGGRGPLLSQTIITGLASAPATGTISANPNPCNINSGQSVCTAVTITWSSQNAGEVQVWLSFNGGSEILFADTAAGTYSSFPDWIQGSPNTYVFRLYDYSGGSRGSLLMQVQVAGTAGTLSCDGVSWPRPYINTYQAGTNAEVGIIVSNVPSASVSVNFLVQNETESLGSGRVIPATQTAGGWGTTLLIPEYTSRGSYSVVPQLRASNGQQINCSQVPAFFAIISGGVINGPNVSCSSMAGSWTDSYGTALTLLQPGNTVMGSSLVHLYAGEQYCGDSTYYVSGSRGASGIFTLLQSNPNPSNLPGCGPVPPRFDDSNVVFTDASCSQLSGTEKETLADSTTETYAITYSSPLSVPSGETSEVIGWQDASGNGSILAFRGRLNAPQSGSFGGRRVRESASSLVDGCYNTQPAQDLDPVTNVIVNSVWFVQTNNTYFQDWLGYGPAAARYYLAYAGNCTLSLSQSMDISGTGSSWANYQTNPITVSLSGTSITTTRGGASQSRTYPPVN